MFLIDILLPLQDERGQPFPAASYEALAQRMTERFGGVTSFARSPGKGRWKNRGATEHDDIVVIEVMTEELDRAWWSQLRKELMREFRRKTSSSVANGPSFSRELRPSTLANINGSASGLLGFGRPRLAQIIYLDLPQQWPQ